jgi:cysteine desulfurase/selenocysteine lyase
VAALGCDFYAFSGHKLYAPFGIGVLYGKATLLDAMPPWQLGGEMVASVSFERATFRESPHRFEAGTPDVEGVIGLGAAIDYLGQLGLEAIGAHERDLLAHATRVLADVPRLRLVGAAAEKIGILSFVVDGVHAHDLGTVLDREGIAIRTGHLCAQPLVERFGVPAVARASLALYNTHEEIDVLGRALRRAVELLG